MNQEEENIDKVERILSGEMSPSEEEAFQLEIKEDQTLREEYAFQSSILQEVRNAERGNAKTELRAMLDRQKSQKPMKMRYIAATVALLIFAGSTIFYFQDRRSDRLEEFYVAFPASGIERGNQAIDQSVYAYANGDYAQALTGLLQEESKTSSKPHLQMMIGSCYLMLDDFDEAHKWFLKVQKGSNRLMGDHALWYETLALVKMNKTDDAIQRLQRLSQQNKYYAGYIEDLLKVL